jgi:hypothetical protein
LNSAALNRIFSRAGTVNVPIRVFTAVCIGAVAVSMTALLLGVWDARRDRDAALQRYVDTQALLALPPVDIDGAVQERDSVAAALTDAEAALEPPAVDPESDTATALLVRSAEAAGLRVAGVNRVPSAQLKDDLTTYDVQGIRMTIDGTVNEVIGFLADMDRDEPGFISALNALTIDDGGVAHAEVVFSVYTEIPAPTPVAPLEAP